MPYAPQGVKVFDDDDLVGCLYYCISDARSNKYKKKKYIYIFIYLFYFSTKAWWAGVEICNF
jgi:hypothetical protein